MAQSRNERVMNAYKIIGERFASIALDGLYTDYYERPVMYALLGDVQGCPGMSGFPLCECQEKEMSCCLSIFEFNGVPSK